MLHRENGHCHVTLNLGRNWGVRAIKWLKKHNKNWNLLHFNSIWLKDLPAVFTSRCLAAVVVNTKKDVMFGKWKTNVDCQFHQIWTRNGVSFQPSAGTDFI